MRCTLMNQRKISTVHCNRTEVDIKGGALYNTSLCYNALYFDEPKKAKYIAERAIGAKWTSRVGRMHSMQREDIWQDWRTQDFDQEEEDGDMDFVADDFASPTWS